MGRGIVFDDGIYFEWSTVVDAPVTAAMTREQMFDYRVRCGQKGWEAEISLERAERTGTSFVHGLSIADLSAYNRAGEGERHLPWPALLAYVRSEAESPTETPPHEG